MPPLKFGAQEKVSVQENDKELETSIETRADALAALVLRHLRARRLESMPDIHSLADFFNVSSSYLRHIVKQKTGIPFCRHIKTLRLTRARQLLQGTFLSVKQVMCEVGLSDHSHFAKDYKKQFGESPTQTRQDAISRHGTTLYKPQNNHLGHKPVPIFRELDDNFNC